MLLAGSPGAVVRGGEDSAGIYAGGLPMSLLRWGWRPATHPLPSPRRRRSISGRKTLLVSPSPTSRRLHGGEFDGASGLWVDERRHCQPVLRRRRGTPKLPQPPARHLNVVPAASIGACMSAWTTRASFAARSWPVQDRTVRSRTGRKSSRSGLQFSARETVGLVRSLTEPPSRTEKT